MRPVTFSYHHGRSLMIRSLHLLCLICCVLAGVPGCSKEQPGRDSSPKTPGSFLGPAILQSNHSNLQTEIRLLRNEIYSRYGRKFRDPMLFDYFRRFPWYKPSETYNDSLLSAKDFADVKILQKYEKALKQLDAAQQLKLKGVIEIFKLFKYRTIDTVICALGDIDGAGGIDTIRNHIRKQDDSILVECYWAAGMDTVRIGRYVNPYFYLGEHPIFSYDTRDEYVILYTALKHSLVQLSPLHENSRNVIVDQPMLNTAAELAVSELAEAGENVSVQQAKEYLASFRGCLLFLSQTEGTGSIQFWYSPAKRFLTFYRP